MGDNLKTRPVSQHPTEILGKQKQADLTSGNDLSWSCSATSKSARIRATMTPRWSRAMPRNELASVEVLVSERADIWRKETISIDSQLTSSSG